MSAHPVCIAHSFTNGKHDVVNSLNNTKELICIHLYHHTYTQYLSLSIGGHDSTKSLIQKANFIDSYILSWESSNVESRNLQLKSQSVIEIKQARYFKGKVSLTFSLTGQYLSKSLYIVLMSYKIQMLAPCIKQEMSIFSNYRVRYDTFPKAVTNAWSAPVREFDARRRLDIRKLFSYNISTYDNNFLRFSTLRLIYTDRIIIIIII